MKNRFHVFSRMFTKLFSNKFPEPAEGTKTIKLNMLLFILFAVFAVPSAWASNIYETVSKNGQVVEPPCSDDKIVTVASGVTSFLITYNQVANGYSMHTVYGHRCEGVLYVNAPSEKTLSFSGKVVLRQFNRIHIYDRSGTSERNMYSKDAHTQATSGEESFNSVYTKGSQASVVFSNDGELDYSNYVKLNVSVHDFHYATVSIPWEKDEPWHFYQIWEETRSGYYESNHIKFHVGRMIYMKNPGAVMDIWGINVKDAEGNLLTVRVLETGDTAKGNLYPGTSYLNRFLYFIMPESDVIVVPTYTRYLRYEQIPRGFGYNLGNESRSVRVDSSIHVYDDGGIDYKYANNFDGYLTVTAHKGHRIKVTGTVATEASYDYLEVFEGMKGASTTPICRVTSTSTNVAVAVPDKCKSADSVLTLHFHTDGSNFADGLNLVLSAEVLSYNVTINNNQTSYGTIRSDKTTAETGSKVTLTASPKSDYFLKSVSVVNTRTNETVTTSEISDNKVTFTMPAGNVKVTPTFAKETYTITQSTVTGGYLNVAYTAKVGTTVWITANPSSGYMLKDIVVKDASGNIVKLNKNDFKSFSFTMPLNNVMIIPSWTTDWSANGGVYVNMPTSGIANAIIPADVKSFKIYDDGGKDGEHSRSNSGTLVLTAPSGYILQLSGRMKSYSSDDYLFVCDGADTTKTKLVKKSYSDNIGVVYSSGQSATLYYYSFPYYDNAHDESALDLTVAVIPVVIPIMYVNASSGGSVTSSSPTQAARDSMVNFTYNYNSGYLVSEINVVAENGKTVKVDGGWYNNKTASFKMPATRNVTVTSTYTNNWSAEGGLYVNMPKTGIVNATIPTGVKSFKIYDDGGKDGLYSNNSNGTLVLTAPDGYVLQVTGSIMTGYESRTCKEYSDDYVSCKSYTYTCNAKDNLSVYDGSSTTVATMLSNKTSDCTTSDGPKNTSLRRLQSGGQSMTLVFKSYVLGYTSSGLDLTVKVVPVKNLITYENTNDGGSVTSSSPTKADIGATVNYTYSYTSGYLVSDIKVVAENGDAVEVFGGWYNNKTATFTMPPSNVTIKSTYTNDLSADGGLYINMPKTGIVNATIPAGVKSFKIYDDGGKDGLYSNNSNGTLVLTAPDGYVLQLTGSIMTGYESRTCKEYSDDYVSCKSYTYTCNAKDNLSVYDGSSTTAATMLSNKTSDCTTLDGPKNTSLSRRQSSGQSMTFVFKSYVLGYTSSGLDLTVTLIPVEHTISDNKLLCAIFGTCVSVDKSTAYVGDTVYLTASSNDEKYVLNKFVVEDANKNVVPVIRNTLTEAFFVMPGSDVQINEGSFDTDVSADNGLHLDLARNAKKEIVLPNGVKSFNLYDDGGALGDYSINSDDTLVVTAPAGYHFKMTGKIYTEYNNYDKLRVYDGSSTTATSLFARGSASTGVAYDVGTIETSSNSMTVYFHSDRSVVSSGLDLLVTIEPDSYAISIAQVDNGSLSSEKTTAIANEKVTLMVHSTEGYYLSGCTILNNGNSYITPSYNSADNTVSFTMPAGPVTITPAFSSMPSINVVSVSGGRVQDEISIADGFKLNATLTATPDDGFAFNGASVVDADGKTVKIYKDSAWYSNVATFNLTKSVTVTPEFVRELSATDGIFVNMPYEGSTRINIPMAVKSFNVYDDGGESGYYTRGADGTVALSAPDGYILNAAVTSMNTNANDHLIIYDGSVVDNAKAILDVSGTETGSISSSGNSITIHFESSKRAKGFEILVTLVPLTINIAEVTGGSMTSDKEIAAPGETVTLTATPADGYLFDGVSVKDADGNEIALSKDIHWYSGVSENVVTFEMPANAVTVTPKFSAVDELYVNMPKSGNVKAFVPGCVKSFKVYDDGGKDGDYSNNVVGRLDITFNGGNSSAISLSGTVASYKGDELTIVASLSFVGAKELYTYKGSEDGKPVDIGTSTNTSGFHIEFITNNDGKNASGIELTFTAIDAEYQLGSAVMTMHDDAGLYANMMNVEEGKYKRIGFINGEYDGDNPVVIYENFTVDTLLYSRNFPANTYSTMTLPFDVNTANIEGPDAVLHYNGIKTVDGKSSIRMKVLWATDDWVVANNVKNVDGSYRHYNDTSLTANTPYLVQMGDATSEDDKTVTLNVKGPVTFKKTTPADVSIDGWTFRGSWKYKKWEDGDSELGHAYGFSASKTDDGKIQVGDFVRVGAGAWIPPMRAYLVKAGISEKAQLARANGAYVKRPTVVPEELPELMSIVIDSDDGNEEHTTVIGHFNTRTGEIKMNYDRGKFDLKGRRVNGEKPNARGAYYGKKILKK